MTEHPLYGDEYTPEITEKVRSGVLEIAHCLGAHMDDIVIVGGLVPSLALSPDDVQDSSLGATHVGSFDVDIAFSLSVRDDGGYEEIAQLLRENEFEVVTTLQGTKRLQHWRQSQLGITVDFIIEHDDPSATTVSVQHLDSDFAALRMPGIELAFHDRTSIKLGGTSREGADVERDVWICGVASFIVLKSLALVGRKKSKDAYDLCFVLRNWPGGASAVASEIQALMDFDQHGHVERALNALARDFERPSSIGPVSVSKFLRRDRDDGIEQDVFALVDDLLIALGRREPEEW